MHGNSWGILDDTHNFKNNDVTRAIPHVSGEYAVKRKIILMSLLVVFFLLALPSTSAIGREDISKLKEKISNGGCAGIPLAICMTILYILTSLETIFISNQVVLAGAYLISIIAMIVVMQFILTNFYGVEFD